MDRNRILIASMALLLLRPLCIAQTASDSPHFEAASVKPVEWQMRGVYFHSDATRIDYHITDLRNLVLAAYPLPWFRVVWPSWMKDLHGPFFDVRATYPQGTTKAQVRLMVQNLLAERFRMVVHRETKEVPVYALLIDDRGLRIQKAKNLPDNDPFALLEKTATMVGPEGARLTDDLPSREPNTEPKGVSISNVVDFVSNNAALDRPMVDMTGLEGNYHVDLRIARDPFVRAPASEAFDDLKKQLGLKVEKKTLPIEMLVIDHLEQLPTPN